MCSDASNGEYEDLKAKSDAECSREGEGTPSATKFHHLSDVLETLIRLDQQGHFMNLLDKSLTSDCTAMCFSKMQEKVSADQYPTWNSFVDDFESICQNAMKHNRKRSEIWNAANLLLRKGRRCLEQQSLKDRTKIGFAKSVENSVVVHEDKSSPGVKLEQNEGPLPDISVAELDKSLLLESAPLYSVPAAEEKAFFKASVKLEINQKGEEGCSVSSGTANSPNSQIFSEKSLRENVMVDILELSPGDVLRLDSNKEATECSSSFGDTQISLTDDEADCQSCEAESDLRNGNGAMVLPDDNPTSIRKKKAVNLEWKTYRQGIEWRCRWLELRVKELQALSIKYDQIVTAKSPKKQELEGQESISARTSAIFDGSWHRALPRMLRRKEEENADSKMHMSKHPVFSRYEKKQQRSQEELINEEINRDDSYQILDFDDFHPDFDDGFGDDFLVEEDSIEQYLWHIEDLQLHVSRLKNLLTRGTISHRSSVGQIKDISYPGVLSQNIALHDANTLTPIPGQVSARSSLGGFKAGGGKSLARKRSADIDIDSVIMPDIVMANYVEPARHAFIQTPHWRVLGDASASARGGSSEEDTDDEAYKKRHVEIQGKETQEQNVTWSKSENVASVRVECAEKDLNVNTVVGNLNGNVQNFSTSFGFVPRRKRRRRESRGAASVVKNIEPLLRASYEDATDPCEPGCSLVEDDDNQKTLSTG